jgi:hypothetical protein
LNGTFSAISGATSGIVGLGGAVVTDYSYFTFSPDGRFGSSNYTTAGSSSDFGATTAGVYSDETGTVGGAQAPGVPIQPTETTNPNPPATTGTYFLDGYTLELRYDDGRVERNFIYFYDAVKRDSMAINGRYYSTE